VRPALVAIPDPALRERLGHVPGARVVAAFPDHAVQPMALAATVLTRSAGDGAVVVAGPAATLVAGALSRADVPARVGGAGPGGAGFGGSGPEAVEPAADATGAGAGGPFGSAAASDGLLTISAEPLDAGPLAAVRAVLAEWAATVLPAPGREVTLASPRAFCAGVERAIEVVERALDRHGPPVYVRRQIVHNAHVVADLERRGAVFVAELDDVPDAAPVVFSAHGVAPAVRVEADRRGMTVVDATCPLVAKVHTEARRFAARGDTVVLIGHPGHDEVEGTVGEVPGMQVVADPAGVARLDVPDPERVAYLTQTTLAVDEAEGVAAALRDRFPAISGPATEDICYATTNRQAAVRAVAADADLVVVLGSVNSSNSQRLVEVSERSGAPAVLVDDPGELDLRLLRGARRIGVTAGASAPPHLVGALVDALAGLGPVRVSERVVATEDVRFGLPREA
jgi:4-hydroxy-3-methylbut-2-enyl diphosphate reductase